MNFVEKVLDELEWVFPAISPDAGFFISQNVKKLLASLVINLHQY